MKPLLSTFTRNGLEFFSGTKLDARFVWDPNRVALAEVPEVLDKEVWAELERWKKEPNESYYQSAGPIRTITINVTQVCNLKCLYCAAGGDGTYGQAQKKADIIRVVPQLQHLLTQGKVGGSLRVTFSGGEPLLFPEGIQVISDFLLEETPKLGIGLRLGIVTNGTLLNQENLELLSRYRMDITVSLDGKPIHNQAQRPKVGGGDPTVLIEAGLSRLLNYRSRLGTLVASGVFNRNNLDIQSAYSYYSLTNFDVVDFNFDYFESDRAASEVFTDNLIKLASTLFDRAGLEGLKKILFFKRVIEHLDAGIKLHHHCGAGQSYVAMDSKGDLYACPWRIGDRKFKVLTPSADTLYQSQNRPTCASCWARPLCGGGCQFQHDSVGGGQIELFCQRMKSLLAAAFMFYIKGRNYE